MKNIKRIRQFLVFAAFAISAYGSETVSFLDQANEAYGADRLTEAVKLLRKALAANENPAICNFNLGNAFFRMDSISRSIVCYQSCVEYAPDFFRGHLNLAIAWYSIKEPGRCIAALRRALSIEPGNKKAMAVLAAAYRGAGGLRESAVLYERIALEDPYAEDAFAALGEIYREFGDPDKALEWLSKYPPGGKNAAFVRNLSADIYEEKGDLQSAIYALKKSFEIDSLNRWLLYRIANLYREIGGIHVAIEESEAALRIFPDFADMALFAGNCAFEAGLYASARQYYSRAKDMGSAQAVIGLENVRILESREE
jgi:tetratricopeptide (TPR) repeat protein